MLRLYDLKRYFYHKGREENTKITLFDLNHFLCGILCPLCPAGEGNCG